MSALIFNMVWQAHVNNRPLKNVLLSYLAICLIMLLNIYIEHK